jgi:hypothetical protein
MLINMYLHSKVKRGTPRAYRGCHYENDLLLFGRGISTRSPKSSSEYWFCRVCSVGSVCYQQRDQHPVQPVPDSSALLNRFSIKQQKTHG